MGVARRSLGVKDVLLLGNDAIIPRNTPEVEIGRVASRILDELVQPMKDVQMDESEFACLKAIVFFDPGKYESSLGNYIIKHYWASRCHWPKE